MTRRPNGADSKGEDNALRVRLPGFNAEVGLGDAIKRITSAVGIRPCGGCSRRASSLNKLVVFTGSHFPGRGL
jgi:hypothetical protein